MTEYENIFNHAYNRVMDLNGQTTAEDIKDYLAHSHGDFPEFEAAVEAGCAAAFAELNSIEQD